MIVADHLRAADALGANGGEQRLGIDLEAVVGLLRDIEGSSRLGYDASAAEQDPTHLAARIGCRVANDAVDQAACNRDSHRHIG